MHQTVKFHHKNGAIFKPIFTKFGGIVDEGKGKTRTLLIGALNITSLSL